MKEIKHEMNHKHSPLNLIKSSYFGNGCGLSIFFRADLSNCLRKKKKNPNTPTYDQTSLVTPISIQFLRGAYLLTQSQSLTHSQSIAHNGTSILIPTYNFGTGAAIQTVQDRSRSPEVCEQWIAAK